ncbi:MAG: hypothetical protein F6K50_38465 [Moorea sp. SIO3I7]|nr:hypothetical protein [Moorena sp. SIO3I7]
MVSTILKTKLFFIPPLSALQSVVQKIMNLAIALQSAPKANALLVINAGILVNILSYVYVIVPKQDSFKQIPSPTSWLSISRMAGLYSKHSLLSIVDV